MTEEPLKKKSSEYVTLAGTIGGFAVTVFVIGAIFMHDPWPVAAAIGALALMGIAFAFFIYKSR